MSFAISACEVNLALATLFAYKKHLELDNASERYSSLFYLEACLSVPMISHTDVASWHRFYDSISISCSDKYVYLTFLGRLGWGFSYSSGYLQDIIVYDTDVNGFCSAYEDLGEFVMLQYLLVWVVVVLVLLLLLLLD